MSEPGRDAERLALEKRLAWEELAVETHKLIGGILRSRTVRRVLSSFDKLFSVLLTVDSASRSNLARVYEERFERPLVPAVEKAFVPREARIIKALLADNVGEALSLQLDIILERRHAERAERLFLALEKFIAQLPRKERRRVDTEFAAGVGRESKLRRVERTFSPELAAFAGAVLRGSRAEADARYIHVMLRWEPFEACRRLIGRNATERKQIDAAYRGSFDIGLESDMRTHLSGSLEALAVDLLGADESLARLSRIRAALERSSDEWVGDPVREMDAGERATLVTRYAERYPACDFLQDLRRRHTARDYEILCDLIERGSVPRAKLLWFSVAGPGTDEAALDALLADTGDTLPELKRGFHEIWLERAPFYERLFPDLMGDLRRRLWLECAGDSWCDLQELLDLHMSGEYPIAQRLTRIHAHERSGYLLKRLDFFSSEGRVMDRDVRLASEYAATLAGRESRPAERLRLEFLVRLAELDCVVFRSLKHMIGNTASTAFAGAGGFVAALSISLLSKEIFHVMLGVGCVSLGIRFALKKLLKGRGYHRDEVVLDLAFAAVDGVTLYLGRVFQKALIGGSTRFASRFGLKKSLDRISREIHGVSAEVEAEDLPELTVPASASKARSVAASPAEISKIVSSLTRAPVSSSAAC